MKKAVRSNKAMREYIRRNMRIGNIYKFKVPSLFIEGEIGWQKLKLIDMKEYYCTFMNAAGMRVSYPNYEVIHLLKGHRFSVSLYPSPTGSAQMEADSGIKLI